MATPANVYQYLGLITSEHNTKPNFMALVQAIAQPFVDIQNILFFFPQYFDLDLATGNQLDIIGQWVGVTRGVNQAIQAQFGISLLPDSYYRTLIKLFIAMNFWDGTKEGMYNAWNNTLGPAYGLLVQDNQDGTMDIVFLSPPTDLLTQAIISQGYFLLRAAGVRIGGFYQPSEPYPTVPIFGFDIENAVIAGFDQGAWLVPFGTPYGPLIIQDEDISRNPAIMNPSIRIQRNNYPSPFLWAQDEPF